MLHPLQFLDGDGHVVYNCRNAAQDQGQNRAFTPASIADDGRNANINSAVVGGGLGPRRSDNRNAVLCAVIDTVPAAEGDKVPETLTR